MKKIKVLLSALAMVAAMALVSCGGKAGDDGTSSPAGETPKGTVVNCLAGQDDGYTVFLDLQTTVDAGSGYTKVTVDADWKSAKGIKPVIQLMTAENNQSSVGVDISKANSADCFLAATYDNWSTGKAVPTPCADGAAKAQLYIQGGEADGWAPVAGTIYVRKITLSAEGKTDLVVYDYEAE